MVQSIHRHSALEKVRKSPASSEVSPVFPRIDEQEDEQESEIKPQQSRKESATLGALMIQQQLPEKDLQRLVVRAQDGDTGAFEVLYSQFFLPIYRYTAFRLPSDVAEDVVADIFVKAWEKLHQYKVQKGIPFGAWLFRIARHTVIDTYRRDRDFEEITEDLVDPDMLNRADAQTRTRDVLRTVREAMDKLPRRYREILVLSYIAELPHHEVARVLKMTEGGVRILKFRALRKLESLLPPDINDRSTES
ncbi:sigma-70 family RNA polymerase sigma factor [Candidatus Peribacteria bacterium]|nr:sigma-70 family RNA polymerase sigma factor [Candidatus Peribacteria bacterium]